jgi:hypothetical protein
MKFYLGTHEPSWLGKLPVPLFVSHRRLRGRKTFPRALWGWALDSGGFSELDMFGGWRTPVGEYIENVKRFKDEIGKLEWAAPQDWMCEPSMLKKTGKTIPEHQRLTTENFLRLRHKAPELPWVPVLQGWNLMDYYLHIGMYATAGVDLWKEPRVGLGSICRRQGTIEVASIIRHLGGLRLHGFGVKTRGLNEYSHLLESADSMAWSMAARHDDPMPGHTHQNCANCIDYAMDWYEKVAL